MSKIRPRPAEADEPEQGYECYECGSTAGFTPHVDWESGVQDDVECCACGSMETGPEGEGDDMACALRDTRARRDQLRAQLEACRAALVKARDLLTEEVCDGDRPGTCPVCELMPTIDAALGGER